MRFFNTREGHLVSSSRVHEMRPGKHGYELIGKDGEFLGSVFDEFAKEATSSFIRDTTGTYLLEPSLTEDGEIEFLRYPVIAWRISFVGIEPVVCEHIDEWYLELRENGKPYAWVDPYCYYFDSIEKLSKVAKENIERRMNK